MTRKLFCAVFPAVLFLLLCSCGKDFQDGDLIFHSSNSSQSKAIQLATHSKYSHMGIIFKKNGERFVLEAIDPVQYTPLHLWIMRGAGSHYVTKRLKNAAKILKSDTVLKMRETGEAFLGRPYDYYFEWNDDRLYCSELVWKIYKNVLDVEIGEPAAAESFDFSSDEVKSKLKERFGDNIPPHSDKVISPGAMFESDKLIKIKEK
jgi:Orthopoxvirus protein of unknown function (DUF830).